MSHSAVAKRICHLPQDYDSGDRSTAALIRESGLIDSPDALAQVEVEDILKEEPQLLNLWLKRGGDQRIAGGWVIDRDDGKYRLKNFETGKSSLIADKFKAHAEFIVRYVGRIGAVIRKYERPAATRG
jgi:hypothetical protein